MKTNFEKDLSGTYNNLDVVLVKNRGWKARLKRWWNGELYDDVWIAIDWSEELHLAQVHEGRLMYGPSINQWKGLITARNLECTIINLPIKLGTHKNAVRFIGHSFKNTPNCIAHIFELSGAAHASIKSLINHAKNSLLA